MDGQLLDVFQSQVLDQCEFILKASAEIDAALERHDIRGVFGALQSLLSAAANVSKACWGQKGRFAQQRERLRLSIGIQDDSPLRSTAMRNSYDHFDERLDAWWRDSKTKTFIDSNVADRRTGIVGFSQDPIDWFRMFDPTTRKATFWGEEFDIGAIVGEAERLLPKLREELKKPHWEK